MTATAAATNAELIRRHVQALQPVRKSVLAEALGWTLDELSKNIASQVKRKQILRSADGFYSLGKPIQKVKGQGRYSRKPDADSKRSRNAAIAKHFHNKLIGVAEGSTQPMTSQEWEALGGIVQILAPTEVSAASRLRFSYSRGA